MCVCARRHAFYTCAAKNLPIYAPPEMVWEAPASVVWVVVGLIGNPPPSFSPCVRAGGWETPSLLLLVWGVVARNPPSSLPSVVWGLVGGKGFPPSLPVVWGLVGGNPPPSVLGSLGGLVVVVKLLCSASNHILWEKILF